MGKLGQAHAEQKLDATKNCCIQKWTMQSGLLGRKCLKEERNSFKNSIFCVKIVQFITTFNFFVSCYLLFHVSDTKNNTEETTKF